MLSSIPKIKRLPEVYWVARGIVFALSESFSESTQQQAAHICHGLVSEVCFPHSSAAAWAGLQVNRHQALVKMNTCSSFLPHGCYTTAI